MTFTAHLALSTGLEVCKPGKRTEKRKREFGYGVGYRISADLSSSPVLITAIDPSFYWALPLVPEGSWLVIHDPTELRPALLPLLSRFRLVCIRESVAKVVREKNLECRVLLHPFYPYPTPPQCEERKKAVCISRIDFDKHIDVILEANKRLGEKRIALYGALNRLCAYHKLGGMDLGLDYRGSFGKSWEELGSILQDAAWVVDMSTIQRDGGGTQYTFLEAIHNGSALVLHRKWIEGGPGPFEEGTNCAVVANAEELVEVIEKGVSEELAREAKKILEPHITVDWKTELGL